MPHAKAQSRKGLRQAAIALAAALLVGNESRAQEAILADGTRIQDATLTAATFDNSRSEATFTVSGEPRTTRNLVRWGEPKPPVNRPGVILADGSRLFSDRDWAPNGLLQLFDDEDIVRLRRNLGWVELGREKVRWLLLTPSAAGLEVERLPETILTTDDLVFLAGGDQIAGRVERLSAGTLTVTVAGQPIETPLEKVAAVRLGDDDADADSPACLVGLSDGSLVKASRLVAQQDSTELTLGGVTAVVPTDALAFVQPLVGTTRYLSDIEPIDYRHTPYLDLAWPYARDHGLSGGPLVGGGRRAAKGLAMHSAARLVYRLDGTPQRFQAELAVADPEPAAADTGSVAFRVYLVKDGGFQAAYEGPTQRVGEPAVPIDLDVTGAAAIALVIDYADDGDAGDDALWLDARLVPTARGG
ncbi:MAG: NPCBM/NEW2 domain-containing protein [Planctomycetota bacterium]